MLFGAPRGRRPSRALGLAFWMVMLGRTTVAGGAVGSTSTAIEIDTSGCVSLSELNAQIRRRSSHIHLVRASGPGRGIKAEIKRNDAGRLEVVLTMAQGTGEPFSRRLEVQTCDEAIETLALLIVLALDPDAVAGPATPKGPTPVLRGSSPGAAGSNASRRRPTGEGSPAPDGPAEPTRPVSSQSSPAPPDLVAPDKPPSPTVVATTVRATAPDSSASWRGRLVVGASGLAIVGPTPQTMVGSSLYAVLGWDRGSPWSPAIAIGVGRSERNGLVLPGGTASFALTAAQVEVCPIWIGMHRRFGGRVCAMGVVGAITAEGTQTLAPELHRQAFAQFGASASLTYAVWWRVMFVASGGLGVPLERYSYQFDPTVFYRAAPVCVTGGLGVGVRFY